MDKSKSAINWLDSRFFVGIVALFCLSFLLHHTTKAAVVVVANAAMPGSVEVADHYLKARSLPKEHLIVLNAPVEEAITWPAFSTTLHNPLLKELVEQGFIQATLSDLTDKMGRRRCLIAEHHIDYLVLCYGIPLKIRNEPALLDPVFAKRLKPHFQSNAASVDTELALLASQRHPTMGFVDNPLFKAGDRLSPKGQAVIKVARLDGPGPAAVRQLIDSALIAEEHGLMGRAYIDQGGPNPEGDAWLEKVAALLQTAGFDVVSQNTPECFSPVARCDAPAWYFGWHTKDLEGPFRLPGYRFPPGAVAVHLHSYAAETLRDTGKRWCGPLVARGVAATLGHVNEPYLLLTHRLDFFVERLLAGDTVGEAAYYALPVLSWQATLIGDPLYRPMKTPLDQQIKQLQKGYFPHYGQSAVLRQIAVLDRSGKPDEALTFGESLNRSAPGVALSLELARRYHAVGDTTKALEVLRSIAGQPYFPSSDWRPAQTLADTLIRYGDNSGGLMLYQKLIDAATENSPMQKRLLQDGVKRASAAGRLHQSSAWERQLQALSSE